MNVVLVCPEIAGNTGNIARLGAATRSPLHLIDPLGFRLDDKELARAGMDYWQLVDWHRWSNWPTFRSAQPADADAPSPAAAASRCVHDDLDALLGGSGGW